MKIKHAAILAKFTAKVSPEVVKVECHGGGLGC